MKLFLELRWLCLLVKNTSLKLTSSFWCYFFDQIIHSYFGEASFPNDFLGMFLEKNIETSTFVEVNISSWCTQWKEVNSHKSKLQCSTVSNLDKNTAYFNRIANISCEVHAGTSTFNYLCSEETCFQVWITWLSWSRAWTCTPAINFSNNPSLSKSTPTITTYLCDLILGKVHIISQLDELTICFWWLLMCSWLMWYSFTLEISISLFLLSPTYPQQQEPITIQQGCVPQKVVE